VSVGRFPEKGTRAACPTRNPERSGEEDRGWIPAEGPDRCEEADGSRPRRCGGLPAEPTDRPEMVWTVAADRRRWIVFLPHGARRCVQSFSCGLCTHNTVPHFQNRQAGVGKMMGVGSRGPRMSTTAFCHQGRGTGPTLDCVRTPIVAAAFRNMEARASEAEGERPPNMNSLTGTEGDCENAVPFPYF